MQRLPGNLFLYILPWAEVIWHTLCRVAREQSGILRLTAKIKKKIIEVFSCFDSVIFICGVYTEYGCELPSSPSLDLLEPKALCSPGRGRGRDGENKTGLVLQNQTNCSLSAGMWHLPGCSLPSALPESRKCQLGSTKTRKNLVRSTQCVLRANKLKMLDTACGIYGT